MSDIRIILYNLLVMLRKKQEKQERKGRTPLM